MTDTSKSVAEHRQDPNRWKALAVVLLASFMDLLDVTIVNVAIPSIQHELHASYAAIQWITAGYVLTFALLLITGGRLGDIFGRKRIFMIGVIGFTIASILCGIAQTPGMLVGARFVQGGMAALMVPQVLSFFQVMFDKTERKKAVAALGGISGLAATAGPLLGGLLIKANLFWLDWRLIFLVNVPFGLIAIFGAARYLRESKAPHALKLDVVGVFLITLALLMIVYPLVQGRELDWPAWTIWSMIGSIPVLVIFALYERYKNKKDGSPLVVPELFTNPPFVSGIIIMATFFSALTGFFFVFTLWLQIGLGFSPIHAALTSVPFSLGIAIFLGTVGQKLSPIFGRKMLSAGALVMILGFIAVMDIAYYSGPNTSSWELAPALFVTGIGLALLVAPIFEFIMAGVNVGDAGSASGVTNAMQQLGGAIGIAIIGVLFFGFLNNNAPTSAASVSSQIRQDLSGLQLPASVQDQVVTGFNTCFTDRTKGKDPSVLPESCQPSKLADPGIPLAAQQRIGQTLQDTARQANKDNFSNAARQSMLYQIGAMTLVFLLVFLLPKHPKHLPDDVIAL